LGGRSYIGRWWLVPKRRYDGFEVSVKRILLGLVLFGLIELALLIKAGEIWGIWFPIAAVVLSMLAGGFLIRHYSVRTLQRVSEALRTGVPPAGQPVTGFAGVFAGILLILPGFLSDFCAVLLLIPSARRIVASALGWRLTQAGSRSAAQGGNGPIIEAEAVEIHGEIRSRQPSGQASPWRR
jgi:UPF0716 protein FxsA